MFYRPPDQTPAETPPVHEEAAILHSAGFADDAVGLLRTELEAEGRPADPRTWLMLLELYRLTGQRVRFDLLLESHAKRVGGPAPCGWAKPSAHDAAGTFALKGVLAPKGRDLDLLAEHARGRKAIAIDLAELERIDYAALPAFTTLLRELVAAGKRVILANVGELNATLLEAVNAHRHVVLMRPQAGGGRASEAGRNGEPYRLLQAA